MRFSKWMLVIAMTCVTSFTCVSAFAADMKVGVMNIQAVINQSEAGKVAKAHFEEKMKELQGKFKTEEEELNALQQEIEKKSSAWSEQTKAEKVREYQKMRRELQAKSEDARFELKQLQEKELEPILKALEGVVKSYGQENGYTAILDIKSGVIYFDESIDISADITKALNSAMGK